MLQRDMIVHVLFFFFFNDTATTEIYTLSLHDALPISPVDVARAGPPGDRPRRAVPEFHLRLRDGGRDRAAAAPRVPRSEEHTSELQSPCNLVCRLLLEKKNSHPPCHVPAALDDLTLSR